VDPLYKIPGWSRYGVTREGRVFNVKRGEILIRTGRTAAHEGEGRPHAVDHAHPVHRVQGPQSEGMVAKVLDPSGVARADSVRWVPASEPKAARSSSTGVVAVVSAANHAAHLRYSRVQTQAVSKLQQRTPHELAYVTSKEGALSDLKVLRKRFEGCHLRGQWYRLDGLSPWIGEHACEEAPRWDGRPVADDDIHLKYAQTHAFFIVQIETGPFHMGYAKCPMQVGFHAWANFEPVLRRMINGPKLADRLLAQWAGTRSAAAGLQRHRRSPARRALRWQYNNDRGFAEVPQAR
jgi:hypothetical protein